MSRLVFVIEWKGLKMKVFSQIVCLWLVLLVLSACALAATPTEESATLAPQSTSTTDKFHSLDTRTGIQEVDAVLDAVESGDPQKLRDEVHYSTLACKTVNALGGPPPCQEGEAEGTLVEVLPILGSEGGHCAKRISKTHSFWMSLAYMRFIGSQRRCSQT